MNKNSRKISVALVCIIAMTFLSSCGGGQQGEQEQKQEPSSVAETTVSEEATPTLSEFNGTWEGVSSKPLNSKVILNCATEKEEWTVLVSLVAIDGNYYNIPCDYAVEDDVLKVWHNDLANRATIQLKLNDKGELEGTHLQYEQSSSLVLKKTSDTPTIGEFYVALQENLTAALLADSNFNRADSVPVKFEYKMDNPKLDELNKKYGLDEIAGTGDTQEKAINLLDWVSDHTNHNGQYSHSERNSLALLEYAYDKDPSVGVNCYNLSVILTEACLSVGIQARSLWLMPQNPEDMDNHVVTMAYIPEKEKWIFLDPSFNGYFMDDEMNVLSPLEIREKLADREKMILNSQASIEYMNYANYLAKNLYYFYSIQSTSFGVFDKSDGSSPKGFLCPKDFDLNKWNATKMRYLNEVGYSDFTEDEMNEREQKLLSEKHTFTNSESFWSK